MDKLPFYVAGAGAGALTSILDLLKDPNQGTIARVGSMLKEHLFGGVNLFFSPAFWGIVLIVGVSLFVCWVFEVTSRLDGFLRGCTILAAFSIGAPGPIINKQLGDLGSSFVAVAQVAGLPFVVSKAIAQASSVQGQPGTATGEVYIVLDHLKKMIPRPDSTVTIRGSLSHSTIAIFKIVDNTARILQPYGRYTVEVETPGFANISFDLTIDQLLTAYSISAQPSSVPLALQKLLAATKVELTPNVSEKYKQLGLKRRLVEDFEGAILNYQQSLALDPNDGLTHDYLGYAYFRLGRYAEAVREFQVAIVQRPDYKWAPINLVKVDCAQQKYAEARQKFEAVRTVTTLWKSDGEFMQLCGSILN
jgi:TPR repeat